MNVVLLVGTIKEQPKVDAYNGKEKVTAYLETSEHFVGKDGQPKKFTTRHRLMANFGQPLKALSACNAGELVDIQGKLAYFGGKDGKPVICEVQVISCQVIKTEAVRPAENRYEAPPPPPRDDSDIPKNKPDLADDDGDLPPF